MASTASPPRAAKTPHIDHGEQGINMPDGKREFDWSALSAPVTMATRTTPSDIKVNVLETIPEPIRERAERSLTINVERVKATKGANAKRVRVDYHWELQAVADTAMGEQFAKLISKYAKYRPSDKDVPHAGPNSPKGQVTARCGNVSHYRKTADGEYVATDKGNAGAFLGVRYSVRPFEQRGTTARIPGTA